MIAMNMPDLRSGETRPLILSWRLWVLMLLSIALALPLSVALNIRFDEAFTLQTTADGPVYAFKQAIGFGQQAPLYFVLMSVWRFVSESIFFARLFSVLCFPLIVWVAAEVSRRYVKDVNPLAAAAIVVLHQQLVWNSLDIRLYALMTLWSVLLLLLFYDAYLADRESTRSRVLFTVVAVSSLYTQYYLGFQLVAGAVALVALGRWRPLGRYVLDMAIAGLFFVPMLIVVAAGQFSVVADHQGAAIPFGELINGLYQRVVPLVLSVNAIEQEILKRWLTRLVIAGIATLFLIKVVRKRESDDVALGAMTVVMTAFFLAAFYLVGDQLMQVRHMSALILPMVLIPLSALTLFKSKSAVYGWAALVIALNVIYLYGAYRPMAKPGDFDRVARYVTENEKPNEPVLIFHADAILPLRYYYHGQNKLVALPQENGTEAWDPRNNVLKDETQIMNVIDAQPDSPERFWLVHDGWCAHGTVSFNCQVLERAIADHFVIESMHEFYAPTTVRLLRRK